MYEIELRALVQDFEKTKKILGGLADPVDVLVNEATIFFHNSLLNHHDLRVRLNNHGCILSYKETMNKTARKEIETQIDDPKAIYEMLKSIGYKIRIIVACKKCTYKLDQYEIKLSNIFDWGNALEVETMVESEQDADIIENQIKEFMQNQLGITEIMDKEKLLELNEAYQSKIDFDKIPIERLIDFAYNNKEIRFIEP